MRSVLGALIGLVLVAGFSARGASAEEQDERERRSRHERILKALAHGVEGLEALGGHEDLLHALHEVYEDELEKHKARGAHPERGERPARRSEREIVAGWIERLHAAEDVLTGARHTELAERMRHARRALEVGLEGRRDDEAVRLRETAPSRAEQAECLFMAAEIAKHRGQRGRAHAFTELARHFREMAARRRHEGEKERERSAELRGLANRVEILRIAVEGLREGKRGDAADTLTRAVHTGELLLEERRGEEAQEVYRRTPKLGQLAELLGLAGRLWQEFGHEKKADRCRELSAYYARRSRQERDEREDDEEVEEEEDEDDGEAAAREREARRSAFFEEVEGALERVHRELRHLEERLEQIERKQREKRAR